MQQQHCVSLPKIASPQMTRVVNRHMEFKLFSTAWQLLLLLFAVKKSHLEMFWTTFVFLCTFIVEINQILPDGSGLDLLEWSLEVCMFTFCFYPTRRTSLEEQVEYFIKNTLKYCLCRPICFWFPNANVATLILASVTWLVKSTMWITSGSTAWDVIEQTCQI